MGNRPRVRGGTNVFSALLFAACIYVASAVVSVEYVTSSAGYPTAGDVSVTVYGSGFGTGSAAFSVRIGSTACSQPALKQTNTRISCKLGKFPLSPFDNFSFSPPPLPPFPPPSPLFSIIVMFCLQAHTRRARPPRSSSLSPSAPTREPPVLLIMVRKASHTHHVLDFPLQIRPPCCLCPVSGPPLEDRLPSPEKTLA